MRLKTAGEAQQQPRGEVREGISSRKDEMGPPHTEGASAGGPKGMAIERTARPQRIRYRPAAVAAATAAAVRIGLKH